MFSCLHRIPALRRHFSLIYVAVALLLPLSVEAQPASVKENAIRSAATPARKTAASTVSLDDRPPQVQQQAEKVAGAPLPQTLASDPVKGHPVDETSRTALLVLLGIAVAIVIVKRRTSRK
jgi:hypothetical protein